MGFLNIAKQYFAAVLGLVILSGSAVDAALPRNLPDGSESIYPYSTVGKIIASGEAIATGTLLADNVVLTAAHPFFEQLGGSRSLSGLEWDRNGQSPIAVVDWAWFNGFTEQVGRLGVSADAALNRSFLLLILEQPDPAPHHAVLNVQNLNNAVYRQVVSHVTEHYGVNRPEALELHATNAGEAVHSSFGRMNGRLFHSGDLKACSGSVGAPVFSFYDGVWSIDGLVISADLSGGSLLVAEIDAVVADFVDRNLITLNATVNAPDLSALAQNLTASPATASELPLGHGRRFSIAPVSDIDYHRIRIAQTGSYTIESFGDLDLSGELYNRQLQLIMRDDDSGTGFNFRIRGFLESGDYFLRVVPFSGMTSGDYGIRFVQDSSDQRFLDDGFHAADTMDLAIGQTGGNYRLGQAGEVDTFRVVVQQSGHFIAWTAGELDLKAQITATHGVINPITGARMEPELFAVNDDGPGMGGNVLVDAFLVPGEYFLRLDARIAGEHGPYQLSTRFYAFEPSGEGSSSVSHSGMASAVRWIPGEPTEGFFAVANETTTFRIDLTRQTHFGFSVQAEAPLRFMLYNENLQQVVTSERSGTIHEVELSVPAGRYYLVLVSEGEGSFSIE